MIKRRITVTSAICVAVCISAWMTSYFGLRVTTFQHVVGLRAGAIIVGHPEWWPVYLGLVNSGESEDGLQEFKDQCRGRLGVNWDGHQQLATEWLPAYDGGDADRTYVMPLWIPTLLFLILMVWAWMPWKATDSPLFLDSRYNIAAGLWRKRLLSASLCVGIICLVVYGTQLSRPLTWTTGVQYSTFDMGIDSEQGWAIIFHKAPHVLKSRSLKIQVFDDQSDTLPVPGTYWLFGLGFGDLHCAFADVSKAKPYGRGMTEAVVDISMTIRLPLMLVSIAALLFAGAVLLVTYYLRSIRRQHGRCLCCGYDMRESCDRCPECGNTPTESEPEPQPAVGT